MLRPASASPFRVVCRPCHPEAPSRSQTESRSGPGSMWSEPVGHSGRDGPFFVYSLLIATVLGTMGLPHILVRFYTNPDGPAARRTTVRVLGLLGVFYLFPTLYGLMGRALAPGLYVTGDTDSRRAALAASGLARHPREPALRLDRRGRLRGLPLHGVGAARLDRGHLVVRRLGPRPRRPCQHARTPPALPRLRRGRRDLAGRARAAWRAASTSACSSAGRSPSPRAASARCSCSASGGAASPPAARRWA